MLRAAFVLKWKQPGSWFHPYLALQATQVQGTIGRLGFVCTTHTILRPPSGGGPLATCIALLAPPLDTCDVPISTSHLSFAALQVTKSFAARLLPRTQFDQWLGQSVSDKLQPWSCRTPPVPTTSSHSLDQWLQLSFNHVCLVVPNSPCVCHSRFYSTVLSVWY